MTGRRLAVVLFNLGGPDRPEAVKPFLLNLFRDPAILRVPFFIRPFLARVITRARLKPATENYRLLGGGSPLLAMTEAQARALESALDGFEARCFVAMRYWHPFSEAVAREVKAWAPDHVVLLPLYPQYSSTTSGSSLTAWREAAAMAGLVAPTTSVCCYAEDAGFARATAAILARAYDEALAAGKPPRVLFSAHGLPESIIAAGDPYQRRIEASVAAVRAAWGRGDADFIVCYQSRATPEKWIGPSTEEEIERAGRDRVPVLIVPIAFVSEHSETLVELDIEYRALAEKSGVPGYFRVPTQGVDPGFITSLADLVRRAAASGPGLVSHAGGRVCPDAHALCPFAQRQPRA
jgi:ferrochelatase